MTAVLLQIIALNFGKMLLVILLLINVLTLVNIPYLIAAFYHTWRLPGREIDDEYENFLYVERRLLRDINCCFSPDIYKSEYFQTT